MTKNTLAAGMVLAAAFTASPAAAQTAVKADGQYVMLSYFKVDPQQAAAYEDWIKTKSKAFYTALMNEPGSNLWGWSIAQILYPGMDEDAPTHVASLIYNGPPQGGDNAARADALLKQVTGMEGAEARKKLASMREALGSELVRGIAWTPGSSPEGSYRVVGYYKSETGSAAENRQISRDVWQPVYAKAAAAGKLLAWSSWSYVFPRGTDTQYDMLTATTFKDLPAAVQGYLPSAADFSAAHPDANLVSAVDQLRGARKMSKAMVSRIIATAQKNVTRQ